MSIALILSGGVGTRMGTNIPKQYIVVGDKPIIGYCLDTFQSIEEITKIVIVADPSWVEFLNDYVNKNGIFKFLAFADSGTSRQHSILNGLRCIKSFGIDDYEKVIIHDAARPCVSKEIIRNCIRTLEKHDNSMPIISVKDTVYFSNDGIEIDSLLDRDKLFAGQAPEGCHLGSYLSVNESLSYDELAKVRGTSAIAFQKGLTVGLFPGSEANYKITTIEDLEKFKLERENHL